LIEIDPEIDRIDRSRQEAADARLLAGAAAGAAAAPGRPSLFLLLFPPVVCVLCIKKWMCSCDAVAVVVCAMCDGQSSATYICVQAPGCRWLAQPNQQRPGWLVAVQQQGAAATAATTTTTQSKLLLFACSPPLLL
jgi:hypothetical protein